MIDEEALARLRDRDPVLAEAFEAYSKLTDEMRRTTDQRAFAEYQNELPRVAEAYIEALRAAGPGAFLAVPSLNPKRDQKHAAPVALLIATVLADVRVMAAGRGSDSGWTHEDTAWLIAAALERAGFLA